MLIYLQYIENHYLYKYCIHLMNINIASWFFFYQLVIFVFSTDTIKAISVLPSNATPIAGAPYSLSCNITGNATTIYWMKNGVILSNTSTISLINQNRTLNISQLDRPDSGKYQCQGINILNNMTSNNYSLVVNCK